jgi:ribose-phosphate pyrophosphokinase
VTNTIALSAEAQGCKKIRQLSVAPLIAETIQRIAKGESVMSLVSDQDNLF